MKKVKPLFIAVLAMLLVSALAAAVWLTWGKAIVKTVKTRLYPVKYTEGIVSAAKRYSLDPYLVAAVVNTESGFDPKAVSGDGAVGLMQVLPSTGEWIAFHKGIAFDEKSLTDPETNLDYGCWLLSYLLERYDGNTRHALIAYNAGFGRLDEWLKDGTDENGDLIDIPYRETRNYVEKITKYTDIYRELYEDVFGKSE